MLVAIKAGRVKIFRVLPSGSAVTLFLFGPGDVFGLMPLLDGRAYPATAQALEQVTALVVSQADLREAFERDAYLPLAFVKLLANRLRDALDRVERSSVPEVLPRVASALNPIELPWADLKRSLRKLAPSTTSCGVPFGGYGGAFPPSRSPAGSGTRSPTLESTDLGVSVATPPERG
jgi:hypothetical protein